MIRRTLAALAALIAAGAGVAYAAPGSVEPPVTSHVELVNETGDSLRVIVSWGAGARAQLYRVAVGDSAQAWRVEKDTPNLSDTIWVPVTEAPQAAVACVASVNRSAIRGEQVSEPRCEPWTVPGDVLAPGQPGPIQVLPDTVVIAYHMLFEPGFEAHLAALGDHEIGAGVIASTSDQLLACVTMPDGQVGFITAGYRDGHRVVTAPSPLFHPLPGGCDGQVVFEVLEVTPGYTMEMLEAPPVMTQLAVWPGETPVVLSDARIRVRVTGPSSTSGA